MSLSDGGKPKIAVLAAVALLAMVSACTVRPLYGELPPTDATRTAATARVASIGVNPPDTRYELEVRNHLIFLLNGGAGEPAEPRYSLELGVLSQRISTAVRQTVVGEPDEKQPTAEAVTMSSIYTLTEISTGEVVAQGKRQITSSYDRPRQEFAALRATRDAENRAARELAELVRLAVLQDLERLPVQ